MELAGRVTATGNLIIGDLDEGLFWHTANLAAQGIT